MASVNASSVNVCRTLVQQLDQKTGLPQNFVDSMGMYMAIKSPTNRRGYEEQLRKIEDSYIDKGLTFPTNQLRYRKPSCDTSLTDCTADYCTPVAVGSDPYGYINVTAEACKAEQFTITNDQFNSVCYGKDEFLAIAIDDASKALLRKVNVDLLTKVNALMGNYADGTSSLSATKNINIINANGTVTVGMGTIDNEFAKIGVTGDIIKVGGRALNSYKNYASLNIPQAYTGLDPLKAGMGDFYYDSKLDTVITLPSATCKMLAWEAGVIQMVEGYNNDGSRKLFHETDVWDTMEVNGIKFDYYMHFNPCSGGGTWTITLKKNYGLMFVPTSAFTCEVEGANNKLKFTLGCGEMTCDMLSIC